MQHDFVYQINKWRKLYKLRLGLVKHRHYKLRKTKRLYNQRLSSDMQTWILLESDTNRSFSEARENWFNLIYWQGHVTNWRAPCNNVLSRLNMFRQNVWQSAKWYLIHVLYLNNTKISVRSYIFHSLATCQLLYKWPS